MATPGAKMKHCAIRCNDSDDGSDTGSSNDIFGCLRCGPWRVGGGG